MEEYEDYGVRRELPPEDEHQEHIRRMILRLVAVILLLAFIFYALNSFLLGFILGNRPSRQPTPTTDLHKDYEAKSLDFPISLLTYNAIRTPYPPVANQA